MLVINIDLMCVAKSVYHEYESIDTSGYEVRELLGRQSFVEEYAGERKREREGEGERERERENKSH